MDRWGRPRFPRGGGGQPVRAPERGARRVPRPRGRDPVSPSRRRSREELADEVGQAYGLVVARLPHDEVVRRLMSTRGLRETAAKDRVKRAYSRLEEDHAPERAL